MVIRYEFGDCTFPLCSVREYDNDLRVFLWLEVLLFSVKNFVLSVVTVTVFTIVFFIDVQKK